MVNEDGADTVQGRLFEPRRPPTRIDRRRFLPSKEQRERGLVHVRRLRDQLAKLDDAA